MHVTPDESHLLARFCAGFRPRRERLVGLEYELLPIDPDSGHAIPYDDPGGGPSVRRVLERMRDEHGWRQVGGDPPLELARHGSRITLEPGAQIELSARPHARLADAEQELAEYLAELREVSEPIGVAWLAMGTQPLSTPDEVPVIPKPRYRIMTAYLPTRGALALWMMRTTAGAQVNLDVESPEQAADMLRLGLWAAPAFNALFANSPLAAGNPAGNLSHRGRIWREVDPDRCGLPEPSCAENATVADYAGWVMDAPMFFVQRDGELIDMAGVPFREFLARGARGVSPRFEDWDLHLTTVFPEARLKSYLELRSVDGNRLDAVMGFAALAAGLVYGGPEVSAAALDLFRGWSYAERVRLLEDAARDALEARTPAGDELGAVAEELLALARRGLASFDPSAAAYLDPLVDRARGRRPPARDALDAWHGDWETSRNALLAHGQP
ncbi:MAG: glutamate--cysteine ligase [Acidobacteriota bacterium]